MKNRWLHFGVPLVLLVSVFTMTYCGNNNEPAPPPQQAGTVPSPSPSPSPTPSPTFTFHWTALTEHRDCPFPDCLAKDGFVLFSDRDFVAGFELDPPLAEGKVPSSDFVQVDVLGREFAEEIANLGGGSQPLTCTDFTPGVGASSDIVRITLDNGFTYIVFWIDVDGQRKCFTGDRKLALALLQEMDSLVAKFYPLPSPSPSPSPSASPSPSPSPSP